MDIKDLLRLAITQKASDLHFLVGISPIIRVDGRLVNLKQFKTLDAQSVDQLLDQLLTQEQKQLFQTNKEIDFSYNLENKARFRVNAYKQKGTSAIALRLIPVKIRNIDELHLPKILHAFVELEQGLILVTGPTGHGKSTTLAAVIDEINQNQDRHIVTIEDPIEYVHTPQKSFISQRELHTDTHSWKIALRSVLREDPDVVLIGEMRDHETIAAALTIAETGHLVFATLHTNSAAQTIDRIVDVFPEFQQPQIRMQLSNTLEAIVSQRLMPSLKGGRIPATEVLLASSAVRTTIREGKTHLVDNIIQTSGDLGMSTLESSLAELVKNGYISLDTARRYSIRPQQLMRQIERK